LPGGRRGLFAGEVGGRIKLWSFFAALVWRPSEAPVAFADHEVEEAVAVEVAGADRVDPGAENKGLVFLGS
jgi:hypothetical protein